MPEYLAPGVYVEEADTGSKPIEGVSTSTAGMVGVTERGPVNVPILITSFSEFTRWFGGYLNIAKFSNSPTGRHCYLPHAVEGFFTNGGKRLFVVRVLDDGASFKASATLFDRGTGKSARILLLRAAQQGKGILTLSPSPLKPTAKSLSEAARDGDRVMALDDRLGLLENDVLRVGVSPNDEYVTVQLLPNCAAGGAASTLPAINLPKGGGAIRGLDKQFAPNPVPDTGSMRVPLTALPSRPGFVPQLSFILLFSTETYGHA